MTPCVTLVRHPEVAVRWRGRCYGVSDMGLSRAGRAAAAALVRSVAAEAPDVVLWSGLRRTGMVAEPLARRTGAELVADPRWRERDFGTWEGRTWAAIYRETGSAMDGMITDPEGFRPGGGETTGELCRRIANAWRDRPAATKLVILAHGGPIAALRALLAGAPPSRLTDFIPPVGEIIRITDS